MDMRACIALILAVMALSFYGCATPQMTVIEKSSGLPALNYEINIRTPNPEEKFNAIFYVTRSEEKSKYSFQPEYLDMFRETPHQIEQKKTAGLYMSLRLVNPKGLSYSVIHSVLYRKEGEKEFKRTDDKIYSGNDADKSWVINCPLDAGEYQTMVTIFRGENIMFLFGDFHYIVN
jgi:hypothetical protein